MTISTERPTNFPECFLCPHVISAINKAKNEIPPSLQSQSKTKISCDLPPDVNINSTQLMTEILYKPKKQTETILFRSKYVSCPVRSSKSP